VEPRAGTPFRGVPDADFEPPIPRSAHDERNPDVATLSNQQVSQSRSQSPTRPILPYALWTVQALLALTFLFAGGTKLVMSAEDLTKDIDLPVLFLRFIGVCEVLGAIGLIFPGVLCIGPSLTPMAAAGLAIIMVGATAITVASMGVCACGVPAGSGAARGVRPVQPLVVVYRRLTVGT
jgi:uncharacterized membrane protein YphA (DoxX/SURF4 family)